MKSEYPKQMNHPGFAPAVLSDDTKAGPGGGRFSEAPPGSPARFPPVVVNNADQEEYHASRGYIVGKQAMPLVTQYTRKERENIRMRTIPQADESTETYEYPKWVGDKIANNPEEEAEFIRIMKEAERAPLADFPPPLPTGIDDAELAEFRAWKAQQMRGSTKNEPVKRPKQPFSSRDRGSAEQRELLVLCLEAGIKADTRYSVKRLREMLDAATAPKGEDHAA